MTPSMDVTIGHQGRLAGPGAAATRTPGPCGQAVPPRFGGDDNGGRRRAVTVLAGLVAAVLLVALPTPPAPAASSSRGEIRVKVVGLKSDQGRLRFGLYNKKETFATSDGPVVKGSHPIKNGECEFVIPDVPFGAYAIIVGHDVNQDGKIDQNPFSSELKGISNYTGKVLWFPDFDKARFTVDKASVAVEIHVY
jgi:uncharacterized protein (DUF2141 family)